jgi:transketolase
MRCARALLLTLPCPSQVVYQSTEDKVTVIGAGITLHEAVAAAEMLKKGTVQLQPDQ